MRRNVAASGVGDVVDFAPPDAEGEGEGGASRSGFPRGITCQPLDI